jgi:phosphotransferase system  glucose/maltose/N-acetylglucosamine-specific IIC component
MKLKICVIWAFIVAYAIDVRWPLGWQTVLGLAVYSLLAFAAYRADFEVLGRIGYALIVSLACAGFLWFVPAAGFLWWVSTFFAAIFFMVVLLSVYGSKKAAEEEEEEEEEEEPYH